IFNYSFNKILKSPSSYILLIISTVVLTGILTVAAFLTSSKLPSNFTVQDFLDQSYSTWILISFAVFIDIILFIFIAIKTTQVFRDEIEDGTLLILVSKPVNRTKIFFEKFLAFELVVGLFIVNSNIVASLSLFIFGTNAYKALAPKILILIAFMLFLQIIFFALTLLISLFTTSKTLVAITIVIGVVASILTFSYSTINSMISSNYDSNDITYSNVSQSAEMDDYFLHNLSKTDFNQIQELIKNPTMIADWNKNIIHFYNVVLNIPGNDPSKMAIDPNQAKSIKRINSWCF
uniref:ABC transporter permease n=1 Tax=Spiroplasma sp. AdecLV25b TaxID=3027162 RepID=UPI0027E037A2